MRPQMRVATGDSRLLKRQAEALQQRLVLLSSGGLWQNLYHADKHLLLQGQRQINKKDSACFWWSLYIMVSHMQPDDSFTYAAIRTLTEIGQVLIASPEVACLQPVIWVFLGVIAIVKLSVGEHWSWCIDTRLVVKRWCNAQVHDSNQQKTLALNADYLLVIAVAVVLNGANVIGYTKCSKQASAQLRDMARNAMTSGITVGHTDKALHAGCQHCPGPEHANVVCRQQYPECKASTASCNIFDRHTLSDARSDVQRAACYIASKLAYCKLFRTNFDAWTLHVQ